MLSGLKALYDLNKKKKEDDPKQPGNIEKATEYTIHEHDLAITELKDTKCTLCDQTSSGKFIQCAQCTINVCSKCEFRMNNDKVKTDIHSHQLKLAKRSAWKCDVCKAKKTAAITSFNCKQCNFDACINCYLIPKFEPLIPPKKKDDKQPQEQQMPQPQPQQPQQPKAAVKEEAKAQPQPQQKTAPINAPVIQNVPIPSNYQYPGGYGQEQVQNAFNAHPHGLYRLPLKGAKCSACFKQENGDGYICHQCPVKLCGSCGHRIFACKPKSVKHHHQTYLVDKKNNYRCNLCRKDATKGTSCFNCALCDWDACINCYYG